MTWHTGPLISFDLETTGVDIETARIVTAAVIHRGADSFRLYNTDTWLADPGVDIPEDAAGIHGITTDRARAEGRPAAEVVDELTRVLAAPLGKGIPIVAMNARFDLSILDRECRRHNVATLEQHLGRPVGPVIDPLVLDKQVDRYRKGPRRLEALAGHYGVKLTAAHTADADALAAVEVVVAIAEKYPEFRVDAATLHTQQIGWAAEQAAGLQRFFRQKDPEAYVEPAWPLVPWIDPTQQ